ncbi:MAG TPA: nitrate- and nitrite sensing domain-containing protein, partial [Acidimicrobiales bacterium]
MDHRGRRRFNIRSKLAVVMCVPMATLGVVVALEVSKIASDTNEIRRQTELATAADGPSGLVKSLQDERSWAAVELIGQGGQVTVDVEGYDETRAQTDTALAGFRDELEHGHDNVIEAYSPAIQGLAGLGSLRDQIDAYQGPRSLDSTVFGDEIFRGYTELIAPFFEGTAQIALVVDHPGLRQGAGLIDTSSRQVEVISIMISRTFNYALLTEGGVNERSEISDLANLLAQFKRNAEIMRSDSRGLYAQLADEHLLVDFTNALAAQVEGAIQTSQIDVGTFLDTVTLPTEDSYNGYRLRVGRLVRQRAHDLNARAALDQRIYLGLILAIVAVAVAVIRAVSLSITRPLHALTTQATAMANHQLPQAVADVLHAPLGEDITAPWVEPITVRASDEVADVAEALNTVQSSALDLAVGQAVLRRNIADSFVNLGRRNQNLLGRQVDFITALEHSETDPDNLANLFQLDHLATRMRRNAESLLVLAGIDPPRQWT